MGKIWKEARRLSLTSRILNEPQALYVILKDARPLADSVIDFSYVLGTSYSRISLLLNLHGLRPKGMISRLDPNYLLHKIRGHA